MIITRYFEFARLKFEYIMLIYAIYDYFIYKCTDMYTHISYLIIVHKF